MSDDRPELGLLSLEGVADGLEVADPRDTELGLMRELGKALVNYMFMALRTLSIHSADNAAVIEPLRRLSEALQELSTVIHRTHFITVEGQVYLNDLRIKTDPSAHANLTYLVGQLDRHGIGGITFHKPPGSDTLKTLLLLILNTRPPQEGDALDAIRLVLADSDVRDIEFDRPYYFKAGGGGGSGGGGVGGDYGSAEVYEGAAAEQEVAALSYAKGVLAVKDYFRAVEAAETANPLRIRKIMHDLVDLAEEDPGTSSSCTPSTAWRTLTTTTAPTWPPWPWRWAGSWGWAGSIWPSWAPRPCSTTWATPRSSAGPTRRGGRPLKTSACASTPSPASARCSSRASSGRACCGACW